MPRNNYLHFSTAAHLQTSSWNTVFVPAGFYKNIKVYYSNLRFIRASRLCLSTLTLREILILPAPKSRCMEVESVFENQNLKSALSIPVNGLCEIHAMRRTWPILGRSTEGFSNKFRRALKVWGVTVTAAPIHGGWATQVNRNIGFYVPLQPPNPPLPHSWQGRPNKTWHTIKPIAWTRFPLCRLIVVNKFLVSYERIYSNSTNIGGNRTQNDTDLRQE
jgi:hypothetical protein